eukprot:1698431-Pleurochrysis_carterae.AAC.1
MPSGACVRAYMSTFVLARSRMHVAQNANACACAGLHGGSRVCIHARGCAVHEGEQEEKLEGQQASSKRGRREQGKRQGLAAWAYERQGFGGGG